MMNRSCSAEGGLRVRQQSIRDSGQCGCGYRHHSVAIGLPSGEILEEFEIAHQPEGFTDVFRIEKDQKVRDCEVAVAMAIGCDGSPARLPAL